MKTFLVIGLTIALMEALTSIAHAAELVTNGGFETGDFTGWTQSGNTADNGVDNLFPHSGSYAASLGPISSVGFLSQTLATVPDQTYTLSFYLQNETGSGFPDKFSASVGGSALLDQTNILAQPYTQYSFDFTATSPSTDLIFGFQNDKSYFDLDDVSFATVPEPSNVMGTLAFGALSIGYLLKRQLKPPKL